MSMSVTLNDGPGAPNARPANDAGHRYAKHHQGSGLPSTSTSLLRDYQGQYPYSGHASYDRLANGTSPPHPHFEGSNDGLSSASTNPLQGFHPQRRVSDNAPSGRRANGESRPFANGQEFNGGPSTTIRPQRAFHSRRFSNSTNQSSSSRRGPNGRPFSMTLPPPPSPHLYPNVHPLDNPREYPQHTQSHHPQYRQHQSPPEQYRYQSYPNHHLRPTNNENQGSFHSAPPNDHDALLRFGAFEHTIQERESQDRRPHQNRTYSQNSILKQTDEAPMEGFSGSQGHRLNMADPDSSMVPDYGVGPSEPPPRNDTFTSSYHGQSHENGRSNNAEPFNNDVDINSDAETHSDVTRSTKRHKASASADTKGKGRVDAGSPKSVNMDIIYETGRLDPTQKKKKGRPLGSKNKPKTDAERSKPKEPKVPKPKEPKAPKPKKSEKFSKFKDKSVNASKPSEDSNHRADKRPREPETEDEVGQLEGQDDMEAEPEKTPPPSNSGSPGGCGPNGGPGGSGGSGGPPGGPGNANNSAIGSTGPPPGPPSNPDNPDEPGSPGGTVDTSDDGPQDNGYRYRGVGTAGDTDTTPPGSPTRRDLVSAPLIAQNQLQAFTDFMNGHARSGAVFNAWRGIVCFDCRNLLQFQQFCNMFSATFGCSARASVKNFLPYDKFELRIKFTFHWTQDHVNKLSRVLQEVRTLERLDLQLCTAAEFNASRRNSPTKASKVTRTTCCTSQLMNLISDNPNIKEVRLRGVRTFFIRDFIHVPDMRRLRVLEMDVDAWEPPTEPEGRNVKLKKYCKRYDKVLSSLRGLEMMVLHCPSASGAFVSHLKKMQPAMYILAHTKNLQRQGPRIQHGGFLIRLKARGTASTFEIGRLDANGNMTDVHAVFTNSDHTCLRSWFTDSCVPESSPFRGLFDHATLWSKVERLTMTGHLPVWCMNALRARRNQDQMTQIHGMALQNMTVNRNWWGHFLNLLATLHLQIFVMRDCAFPGNKAGASEVPTNWSRLFDVVGQQGQVAGLGLVNIDFGDGGEVLMREFWNLVDEREIHEQNAEGQAVPVLRPRWGALTWVDISGSLNTNMVHGPFQDSREAHGFEDVRIMDLDPDHIID
ncbi:hypothetical protein BG006_006283 [Podila minutissima]|uniref:Uncharacterized protein n=1 Tax=Podila minutissima TaxID=64525 RepID=A0A9P5SUP6_9FUNG|nr:hypothetical protein BG006_006283 [Podila minutissima]